MAPRELPSGTVTFLFTDIEGSTKLLHELGPENYERALAEHRRVLRDAFGRHEGVEVDTQGDAFFIAFPTARGALAAAEEGRQALAAGPIRVRMGRHTGTPFLGAEGYVGADVNRGADVTAVQEPIRVGQAAARPRPPRQGIRRRSDSAPREGPARRISLPLRCRTAASPPVGRARSGGYAASSLGRYAGATARWALAFGAMGA